GSERDLLCRGLSAFLLWCVPWCAFALGFGPSGWVENDFVVNVARGHGRSVSIQRFSMWPRSLPLYGATFHLLRCCFPRLWPRSSAAWTIRVEVDRRRNNRWRLVPYLCTGAVSRSISAKRLRTLTHSMKPTA